MSNTLVIYIILEVLLVSLLLNGGLFWLWRRDHRRSANLDTLWRWFRKQREKSSATTPDAALQQHLKGYWDALEALQQDRPPGQMEHWETWWDEIQDLVRALHDLHYKYQFQSKGSKTEPVEEEAKDVTEEVVSLGQMENLLEQQRQRIAELTEHKNALLRLVRNKFTHVNASNEQMLGYMRNFVGKEKASGMQMMVDRLQDNSNQMRNMIEELERQKTVIEPKMQHLAKENQQLRDIVTEYKREIRRIIEERTDWQNRYTEVSAKFDARVKSYDRLYRRFEALRREYMTLYGQKH